MRRIPRSLVLVIFVAFLVPQLPTQAHGASRSNSVPHAFVIVMENKSASELVGNRHAPYINQLIREYGYAANYYGVTHPSLPNYLALIAGDFLNTWDDWDGHRYRARTIADQLEARRLTWKAYMGGLPRTGYTGNQYPAGSAPLYESKHDPFVLMQAIRSNPRHARRIDNDRQLYTDLARNKVPTLSFISPDMCHDMHGIIAAYSPCPANTSHLIASGDSYLKRLIPVIMRSRSWSGNSLIFLVWDEAERAINGCCGSPKGDGGGRVVAVVISREGVRHFRSTAAYNHYSVLKTLEDVWHLGCLANTCKKEVRPMTEFLRPHR